MTPLTFILFCFSWLALIVGAVLGYIIGVRIARSRERHRVVKERIKKNRLAIHHYQKEKYDYLLQINRLEDELNSLTEESEQYKERISELDFYQRRLRESEEIIERLSAAPEEMVELSSTAFSLLIQLREDPEHTNLTRPEWTEILRATDQLFNHILTKLREQAGITRHEEEICALIKWNFSRKEQMAIFNNTTEALTKSKGRLKKKLSLDDKTDLDQFIRLF